MKRKFDKSTTEEVEEMRELHKKKWSLAAIAKRFKKDHTSIFYWLRKDKNYRPNPPGSIPPEPIPMEEKEEEVKIVEEDIIKDVCISCGDIKENNKWKSTLYCGVKCWDKEYLKRKFPLEFRQRNWDR